MPPLASVTVVGLGPGDPQLLTLEAREVLAAADEVWLRTARHPTVAGLPHGSRYESFDDVYEQHESFGAVYEAIVARVIALASREGGAIYAVPGHPLFGEATVRALLDRAEIAGISVRIVPGVSFLDTVAVALGLDPLAGGLLVLDALALGGAKRLLVPQRPTLVAQVYDRRAASQAKLALLEAYPPEHPVRVVHAGGGAASGVFDTTLARLDHDDVFDHLVTLYVPPLAPVDDVRSFEGLRAVVAQLRSPDGGCPWDLEQTHESLKRYLLEEAYETLDALDDGDTGRLAEELGDLLMQIVLHAQVAEDNRQFAIEDVFSSIARKLVRRHPHVFGDMKVASAREVLRNWDVLKKEERGAVPVLDAVPKAMPALAQAQSVLGRATKAGLADLRGDRVLAAARRIFKESESPDAASIGELLFAVVALAREHDIDAEEALRLAVRRFRAEVGERERLRPAAGSG